MAKRSQRLRPRIDRALVFSATALTTALVLWLVWDAITTRSVHLALVTLMLVVVVALAVWITLRF